MIYGVTRLKRELIPVLANLKLAIVLLLVIALVSVTGTVIEQGEPPAFYEANYPLKPALFGFITYQFILTTGLNQVYSSWWFLCLLILFASSLISCTFYRQIPLVKVARRWHFYTKSSAILKLPITYTISNQSSNENQSLDKLAPKLRSSGYQVFLNDQHNQLYARKGLVGRIAPIVVHLSILIILAGAIWGAVAGFTTQAMIPSGTTAKLAIPHRNWKLQVHRFWIDYTAKGSIDQFYSDLSLLDENDRELTHKTIYVNEPLRYQGVTFYQASWNISAIRFRLNQSPIFQVPLQKLESKTNGSQVWGTWLPTKPDLSAGITLVTPDLQGTFVIYDQTGKILTSMHRGETKEINGVNLSLLDVIGDTGLQIKADPSIPLVYAGFALLMISVVASYISHSQVWALTADGQIYVGAKTNRSQVVFGAEMAEIWANFQTGINDTGITDAGTTDSSPRSEKTVSQS